MDTEQAEAEAVVAGLSEAAWVRCDCGLEHRPLLADWFICVCDRHWHRYSISGNAVWFSLIDRRFR